MNSISPQMLGVTSSQMTLVKSADLAGERDAARSKPVKRLLRAAVRWRWVLIGSILAGVVVGGFATLLATRQYTSVAQLEISRETSQVVNVGALSRDVPVGDQEFYQTQFGLLRTKILAERVARDIGVVDDPAFFKMFGKSRAFGETSDPQGHATRNEIAGQVLLERVVVAPIHGSSLVDIQATSPSAALSAKIAQTWAEDFIASNLERRVSASSYARRFLEGRIDELRGKLERSEHQAVDYAVANGIIDLSTGAKTSTSDPALARSLVSDNLGATNVAREAAAAERIQAAARLAAAGDQPEASSEALNYRAIGKLREERAAAAAEHARLASQLSPNDPATKAAQAQVDTLDAAIRGEGQRVRAALQQSLQAAETREQALTRRVDALKGSLADQRQRSVQYNIYQRDADTNRELYDALLQRDKEIGVAGTAENNNIAVVDEAKVPARPSSPRLMANLALFTLVGALIGAGAVAVLERINDGIAEPDEFEQALGLQLFGVAPNLKGQTPLDAMSRPRSGFAEAFLATQANLELATARGAPTSIALVSACPQEGKSTVAIALARTLARSGRKVALIDANLRAPSIHSAFGLANSSGVSEVLAGGVEVEAVLRESGIDGLSIITAGAPVANPGDLLIGPGLTQLVKTLQAQFDRVIVDGPAITALADGPLVASAVEGVLCVVVVKSTSVSVIQAALGRLQEAQLLGGVLTLHDARRSHRGS